ncbi:MAG: hydantoinase/oxoprolinase N-terminal domain-containing protein, partial [Dehalococcoidia bacterium]|nr:hydantoinase/oxoprolinase N-terminal domain-containing protein [Dehalococcoidia bacterium]
MTQPTHSLSIDIGGTFTDFTLVDLESGDLRVHKVLTNADDPAQGL